MTYYEDRGVSGLSTTPELRFRVWVRGALVDDETIDVTDPDSDRELDRISAKHFVFAMMAEQLGAPWRIEATDGGGVAARIGSDPSGMVRPVAVVHVN